MQTRKADQLRVLEEANVVIGNTAAVVSGSDIANYKLRTIHEYLSVINTLQQKTQEKKQNQLSTRPKI